MDNIDTENTDSNGNKPQVKSAFIVILDHDNNVTLEGVENSDSLPFYIEDTKLALPNLHAALSGALEDVKIQMNLSRFVAAQMQLMQKAAMAKAGAITDPSGKVLSFPKR